MSIELDGKGGVGISYFSASDQSLRYAERSAGATGTWSITTVAADGDTGRYSDLAYDADGTRMHRGMDFATAKGMPVYAAADGVVNFADRNGGFGNFIKLTHSENLATSYAHLARFADGIRVGDKVSQGQLIGVVGTTGLTSGPNLHYEVLVNEEPVDPIVAGTPVNHEVVGAELTVFWAAVSDLNALVTESAQRGRNEPRTQ